jgi:DNA-directed RNA polymerase subunit RPC12/RpoP
MATPEKIVLRSSFSCLICNKLEGKLFKISSSKINNVQADVVLIRLIGVSEESSRNATICQSCSRKISTIDRSLTELRNLYSKNCSVKRLVKESPPPKHQKDEHHQIRTRRRLPMTDESKL